MKYKSFSQLRKKLKANLCDKLQDRIDFFYTAYHQVHNSYTRGSILCDKAELVSFSWIDNTVQEADMYNKWLIDGSWDFHDKELTQKWNEDCTLSNYNFINSIQSYLSQDIKTSLESQDYIVKALAILDLRVGKRTLEKIKQEKQYLLYPYWLQQFYFLRFSVEGDFLTMPIIKYHHQLPNWFTEFATVSELLRLNDVGMNCGVEYTSFPLFKDLIEYNRYQHSIGVALIIYHFTNDITQTLAGLYHDIATPVFAHSIDFLCGDYDKQETTESLTEQIIKNSKQIQNLCTKYHIDINSITDYHRYPIADNDTPKLSADRLEYSLGNMLRFKCISINQVQEIYDNVVILKNENNEDELGFNNSEIALIFAQNCLTCSKVYVSDNDRYAMEKLAQLLKVALNENIIDQKDINGTEKRIINKLTNNEKTKQLWQEFIMLNKLYVIKNANENALKIPAKKRFINPLVLKTRVDDYNYEFRNELESFLQSNFDYYISTTK